MKRVMLAAVGAAALLAPSGAFAQVDPYLGQLMLVPYNFCPRSWADASGQILSIAQNTALFSLIGTTYGGNGTTTFALPDLRGRVAVHQGQGPGLPNVVLGQIFGASTTTLTINQMPAHSHSLNATTGDPDFPSPTGHALAKFPVGTKQYAGDTINVAMATGSVGLTGSSQPFDQYQPSLGLRYCIALEGTFPPRD